MSRAFGRFTAAVSAWLARPAAFLSALLSIIVWAVSGPFLKFSDGWSFAINTGTSIISFLMLFLLQAAQSRDNAAVQLKLDGLIRVSEADNSLIAAETRAAEEIAEAAMALRDEIERG